MHFRIARDHSAHHWARASDQFPKLKGNQTWPIRNELLAHTIPALSCVTLNLHLHLLCYATTKRRERHINHRLKKRSYFFNHSLFLIKTWNKFDHFEGRISSTSFQNSVINLTKELQMKSGYNLNGILGSYS